MTHQKENAEKYRRHNDGKEIKKNDTHGTDWS